MNTVFLMTYLMYSPPTLHVNTAHKLQLKVIKSQLINSTVYLHLLMYKTGHHCKDITIVTKLQTSFRFHKMTTKQHLKRYLHLINLKWWQVELFMQCKNLGTVKYWRRIHTSINPKYSRTSTFCFLRRHVESTATTPRELSALSREDNSAPLKGLKSIGYSLITSISISWNNYQSPLMSVRITERPTFTRIWLARSSSGWQCIWWLV